MAMEMEMEFGILYLFEQCVEVDALIYARESQMLHRRKVALAVSRLHE
jgi:hypothetical protein